MGVFNRNRAEIFRLNRKKSARISRLSGWIEEPGAPSLVTWLSKIPYFSGIGPASPKNWTRKNWGPGRVSLLRHSATKFLYRIYRQELRFLVSNICFLFCGIFSALKICVFLGIDFLAFLLKANFFLILKTESEIKCWSPWQNALVEVLSGHAFIDRFDIATNQMFQITTNLLNFTIIS